MKESLQGNAYVFQVDLIKYSQSALILLPKYHKIIYIIDADNLAKFILHY